MCHKESIRRGRKKAVEGAEKPGKDTESAPSRVDHQTKYGGSIPIQAFGPVVLPVPSVAPDAADTKKKATGKSGAFKSKKSKKSGSKSDPVDKIIIKGVKRLLKITIKEPQQSKPKISIYRSAKPIPNRASVEIVLCIFIKDSYPNSLSHSNKAIKKALKGISIKWPNMHQRQIDKTPAHAKEVAEHTIKHKTIIAKNIYLIYLYISLFILRLKDTPFKNKTKLNITARSTTKVYKLS
ncbi:Teneurin-4 [Fusarium oxysporum f. sp. albedinis]|nr:Teneurin-4 [Fusarium oxysporum f. sp. albedinis]